ncbi:hypothetical protein KC19_2G272600 [Ceratodon purpureus]|uniref:Uncharacterized protein n=1 Tax=Ceratodon purpureus TaxID=3225 RepID=A0A8T0IYM2_CERPU|nr:hypothetical protein KC19_2G272600 [Ceratodon purpureus]
MSRIGEGFGRLEVLLTSVQCTKAVVFAGSCCMFRSERLYLTMRAVSFPCTQMLHQESLLTVVLRTTRCPAFEQINFRRAPNCAMQGIIRIQLSSYSGVRCGHQRRGSWGAETSPTQHLDNGQKFSDHGTSAVHVLHRVASPNLFT